MFYETYYFCAGGEERADFAERMWGAKTVLRFEAN